MRIALVPLLALFLFTGCKSSEDAAAAAVEEMGVEAPNALEEAAGEVAVKVPRTGVKAELTIVRGLVRNYQRIEGKFPASLEAIDTLPRLQYGDEYDYDPETGAVTSKSFPEL